MKLESLKSSKFEALSENAMKHIVGGQKCETPAGEHEQAGVGCVKHSNDYNDGGTLVFTEGGDFSKTTMDRLEPCSLEGSATPSLTDSSLGGTTNGITL